MDIIAVIGELRKERDRLDRLILALDKLQHGRTGPGRPLKMLQELRRRAKSGDQEPAADSSPQDASEKTERDGSDADQ